MKKFFLIGIIFVSCLFCTACINNLAIQELNQMGAEYLQKGDIDNAIARFKSSVDLDENIFESRYNLGVAYIQKENYKDAIPELEAAVKLRPNSKDAIYSYAVALETEGLQFEINPYDDANLEEDEHKEIKISRDDVVEGLILVNSAILAYENYLKLNEDQNEKEKVNSHIQELKATVDKYKEEYEIDDAELRSEG